MSSDSESEASRRSNDCVFSTFESLRINDENRKRKREDLLQKMVSRKTKTINLVSAAKLDPDELAVKLSKPRLSWDFTHAAGGNANELEVDADKFGGSDSRTALNHHIKLALSQANVKKCIKSSIPTATATRPSGRVTPPADDHILSEGDSEMSIPRLIPVSPKDDMFPDDTQSPSRHDRIPRDLEDLSFSQMSDFEPTQVFRRDTNYGTPKSDTTEPRDDTLFEPSPPKMPRRYLQGPSMTDDSLSKFLPVIPPGERKEREAVFPADIEDVKDLKSGSQSRGPNFTPVVDKAARQKIRSSFMRSSFLDVEASESEDEDFMLDKRHKKKKSNEQPEEEEEDSGEVSDLMADESEEKQLHRKRAKIQKKNEALHSEWQEQQDKLLEDHAKAGSFKKLNKFLDNEDDEPSALQKRREALLRSKYDSNGERILDEDDFPDYSDDENDWLVDEDEDENGNIIPSRNSSKNTGNEEERMQRRKELRRKLIEEQRQAKRDAEIQSGTFGLKEDERLEYESLVTKSKDQQMMFSNENISENISDNLRRKSLLYD
jgi:hypothetical protein